MSLKQPYDDIYISPYSKNIYVVTKPGVSPLEQYELFTRRRRKVGAGGVVRPWSSGGGGMFDNYKLTDWLGLFVGGPIVLFAIYYYFLGPYLATSAAPTPAPTAIVQQVEVVVTATPAPQIPANLAPPAAMLSPENISATATTRAEIDKVTKDMGTIDTKKPVQFITFSYQETANYPVCLKAGLVAISVGRQPFFVYLGPEISLSGQNPNNRQARVQGDFVKDADCVLDIFYPTYLEFLGAEQPMVTPVAPLAVGGPISYSTIITDEAGITRTIYYTSSFTPGRSYVPVRSDQIANYTPSAVTYRTIPASTITPTQSAPVSYLGELTSFKSPSCNTTFAIKIGETIYPMEFQTPALAPRTFNEKQALVFGSFKMVCGQMGLWVTTASYTSDSVQAGAAVTAIVQRDTGGFAYIAPTATPIPTATKTPQWIYVTGNFITTASQCNGTNLAIEGDGGQYYYVFPTDYNPNNVRDRAYIAGVLGDKKAYDCPDEVIVGAKIVWIEPTATPTPSATATFTPTPTPSTTATFTATPTPSPTIIPTATGYFGEPSPNGPPTEQPSDAPFDAIDSEIR